MRGVVVGKSLRELRCLTCLLHCPNYLLFSLNFSAPRKIPRIVLVLSFWDSYLNALSLSATSCLGVLTFDSWRNTLGGSVSFSEFLELVLSLAE